MALTSAQRAGRRAEVLEALRAAWRPWLRPGLRDPVELTLQDGRRRPRVAGVVHYVATSGSFVLLNDREHDPTACVPACRCDRHLHVPVDVIRSVRAL